MTLPHNRDNSLQIDNFFAYSVFVEVSSGFLSLEKTLQAYFVV